MFLTYLVPPEYGSMTLEQLLREALCLSAKEARDAKRIGITVDGEPFFPNQRVGAGKTLRIPLAEYEMPEIPSSAPPVHTLYEDEALIAVQKPAPLQCHPSPSAPRGSDTLEGRVQHHLGAPAHPVHRLDAETTGVVLFAKLPFAQAHIQRQMQEGTFHKTYLALVCGVPEPQAGVIDAPIARIEPDSFTRAVLPDGQHAVSQYAVEKVFQGFSLVRLSPLTGRTHQLRVHMAYVGCPLLGDTRYFTEASAALSQALHIPYHQLSAVRLSLLHPLTGKPLVIECAPDFIHRHAHQPF